MKESVREVMERECIYRVILACFVLVDVHVRLLMVFYRIDVVFLSVVNSGCLS